jgi:hypothetical protein
LKHVLEANCLEFITRFDSVAGLDDEDIILLTQRFEAGLRGPHGQLLSSVLTRTMRQLVDSDDSSYNSKSTVGSETDGSSVVSHSSEDSVKVKHDESLRTLIGLHEAVNFTSKHCPPLDFLPMELGAECDCNNFGIITCILDEWVDYDAPIDFSSMEQDARATCDEHLRQPNNHRRKDVYRRVFSVLDFQEVADSSSGRRELPKCACARIRQIYPNANGDYMGFLDA